VIGFSLYIYYTLTRWISTNGCINYQDKSRNGITLNGQYIRKSSVILMDGDILQLPNSLSVALLRALWFNKRLTFPVAFVCRHLWKEHAAKLSFFEPSQPLEPVQKVCS
jgi:meiosis-specific serine/threonine-protein kinase MEK1